MARMDAPELAPALAWINVTRPLTVRDLRGRVVILDFWSSCSVDCMHMLPLLRDLAVRHEHDPVLVIGVHSAKAPTAGEPERVADAVARLGITYPVVVDDGMQIWERYGLRSWPTLVILQPDGIIAAVAPGEPDPSVLEQFVSSQLRQARATGLAAIPPVPPACTEVGRLGWCRSNAVPATAQPDGDRRRYDVQLVAFPSKLAVHSDDGRIAVADPGHHRVLVLAPTGEVLTCIGTGARGHADGPFARAVLDEPRGVAWDDELLWICDARNHVLLRADFLTGHLVTMAGTGHLGRAPVGPPEPARRVALRSPWDVVVDDTRLYVALAGSHQLAVYDKVRQSLGVLAGAGRAGLVDGALTQACLAQPSGLSLSGRTLYVADSETSAIRVVDLEARQVTTLPLGTGMFDSGFDGGGTEVVRLQHPLHVLAVDRRRLVVADTYNDALRLVDLDDGTTRTLFGPGGTDTLREPAGLALDGSGAILVADTGRHRIARIGRDGAWLGEMAPRSATLPAPQPAAPREILAAVST